MMLSPAIRVGRARLWLAVHRVSDPQRLAVGIRSTGGRIRSYALVVSPSWAVVVVVVR